MAELDRGALRKLSRIAFGQDYRLELMLAIREADGQVVTLGELASQLAIPVSSIQKPFHALVDAGLLTFLDTGESRRKFYQANKSAAWDWAAELASNVSMAQRLRTD